MAAAALSPSKENGPSKRGAVSEKAKEWCPGFWVIHTKCYAEKPIPLPRYTGSIVNRNESRYR